MLGYGWAGIFRKVLVDSPYMWWPSNLVQVSLFRYFFILFISWFLCVKILAFLSCKWKLLKTN
jgi:hypothetical protein